PTWYSGSSPSPSASMTPTGSCPSTSPLRTGYSPFTMGTSVPQRVGVVPRITACPALCAGLGRSSTASVLVPRNATTFMVSIYDRLLPLCASSNLSVGVFAQESARNEMADELVALGIRQIPQPAKLGSREAHARHLRKVFSNRPQQWGAGWPAGGRSPSH